MKPWEKFTLWVIGQCLFHLREVTDVSIHCFSVSKSSNSNMLFKSAPCWLTPEILHEGHHYWRLREAAVPRSGHSHLHQWQAQSREERGVTVSRYDPLTGRLSQNVCSRNGCSCAQTTWRRKHTCFSGGEPSAPGYPPFPTPVTAALSHNG